MPPRNPNRCVYREGSNRCPRQGTGKPCLCEPHRVLLESDVPQGFGDQIRKVMGKLVRGERVRPHEARGAVIEGVGFVAAVAQAYVQDQQPVAPGSARPPPKKFVDWAYEELKKREREATQRRSQIDPRVVLEWPAGQRVTVEDVQKRRRELARKYHPDKPGGSVEKMQAINAAADALIAQLEGHP